MSIIALLVLILPFALYFHVSFMKRIINQLYFFKWHLKTLKVEETVFMPDSVPQLQLFLYASVSILLYCVVFFIPEKYLSLFVFYISFVTVLVLYQILRRKYEAQDITRRNNLNVGYGCAIWYYYNYLKKIKTGFVERVRTFEMEQEVKLVPKLFILFPSSGVIKDYVDDVDHIQRCRELFTFTIDFSGVKKRVYKLTVYQIFDDSQSRNSVRCIMEYAQPLKTLLGFKGFSKLSDEEVCVERNIFYKTLMELTKDDECYKLVQFDDENSKLYTVIYDTVESHI